MTASSWVLLKTVTLVAVVVLNLHGGTAAEVVPSMRIVFLPVVGALSP